jgi:glycosyltransferase involved in cell wall biosynthesis
MNTSNKEKYNSIIKHKNTEIAELKRELNEYHGFQKGILWKTISFYRFLKKSPNLIFTSLQKNGLKKTAIKAFYKLKNRGKRPVFDYEKVNKDYTKWVVLNKAEDKLSGYKNKLKSFQYQPLISIIVPVYNVDEIYLREAFDSVISQIYSNWELCIANDDSPKPLNVKEILEEYKKKDKRIKVVFREKRGQISAASNSALKLATGEFIALLDNDDILYPKALYKVVEALNKDPSIDFLYSDEDKLELNGDRSDPFFKPDWSPDLFMSSNYLCHLSVIRKSLIDKVGGFRVGYEGSQDYDLFLRVIDLTNKIYHIPDILYSWRKIPGSTATNYDEKGYANNASIKALSNTLKRRNIAGIVENGILPGMFRVVYEIKGDPLVSIVIPIKDKADYLRKCIKSIVGKTDYKNYEIVIVDTGSVEELTFEYLKELKDKKIAKIVYYKGKVSFSAFNNFGAKATQGKYILFLNNDTEVINSGWLSAMLEFALRKNVGAVGAKLLYPNKTIQHAGVLLGLGDDMVAGHIYIGFDDRPIGLPVRKDIICNYSAITAACILIRKKYFEEVRGFTEKLKVSYNDTDLCLKLREKGLSIIYTPYAKLYHFESVSFGKVGVTSRKIDPEEIRYFKKRWKEKLAHDPYFNPNLALDNTGYKISTSYYSKRD